MRLVEVAFVSMGMDVVLNACVTIVCGWLISASVHMFTLCGLPPVHLSRITSQKESA